MTDEDDILSEHLISDRFGLDPDEEEDSLDADDSGELEEESY